MRIACDFRREARRALTGRYFLCVIAALIAGALGGTASVPQFTFTFNESSLQQLIKTLQEKGVLQALEEHIVALGRIAGVYGLVLFLIGGAMELGYNRFNLQLYTGERPSVTALFSRFSIFGRALWLRVLIYVKMMLWSLLLVVPGIIASYRYAMAPFLLAEDPTMGAMEAIERSKVMMRGNKLRLFTMQLSFIGWYLLVLLTAGIGGIFLAPYTKAADAAFYLDISGRM